MSHYEQMVAEATGETNVEIVKEVIFMWMPQGFRFGDKTTAQINRAARKAYAERQAYLDTQDGVEVYAR